MSKAEKYRVLIQQINALVEGESDRIANTSNIIASLMQSFEFFWLGCYFVQGDELVLGPFQGPVACTRIKKGKGVCGAVWSNNEALLVPNVHDFPGHIACSAESNSELVVPLLDNDDTVIGVLDADSREYDHFDEIDKTNFIIIAKIIAEKYVG